MRAKSETTRMLYLGLGWLLLALVPVVGPLPGPGGIFLLAGGLILLLRNSAWARRRYVGLKRRWPRTGRMCDRAMRRQSERRRREIARAIDLAGTSP